MMRLESAEAWRVGDSDSICDDGADVSLGSVSLMDGPALFGFWAMICSIVVFCDSTAAF